MKFVASSDWHPDATTAGFARFDDVRSAALQTVEHAMKVRAKGYFFLGDLVTNDPPNDLMIRCIGLAIEVAQALSDANIPSFWLVGNHDVFEDGAGTTAIDPVASVPRAMLVKQPTRMLVGGGVDVIFLPFTPSSRNYDPIAVVRDCAEGSSQRVDLVLGHLLLEGIGPGSETNDFPRGRDVFFPIDEVVKHYPGALMMNGHYHHPQVYRGVHVPGSLVTLTRGERYTRPGFLTFELEPKEPFKL